MTLDEERDALIAKIEAAFVEQLSGEALATFLREMPLADSQNYPYEAQGLDDVLRGHTWREMLPDARLVNMLKDVDYEYAISSEALAYYLPAFMIQAARELDWSVYLTFLTPKIIEVLPNYTLAQIETIIALADYKVHHERLIDDGSATYFNRTMIDAFEDLGLHVLMYLDENESLVERHDEPQKGNHQA